MEKILAQKAEKEELVKNMSLLPDRNDICIRLVSLKENRDTLQVTGRVLSKSLRLGQEFRRN